MPCPRPPLVQAAAPGLVEQSLLSPIPEPKETSLQMVAAATRYLYRCRRSGDDRSTAVLLRDLVAEADASKLEAAVAAFFAEERLT
jgi:hypothetical protein